MTGSVSYANYSASCNKGYNYLNRSQFGNMTAFKGSVPVISSGSGQLSIDTSSGSKYSDYTFYCWPGVNCFTNFNRILKNKKLRFYARYYYDYDVSANQNIVSKANLNNNQISTVSVTLINFNDLNISPTFYNQINLKSSKIFNSNFK